MRRIHFETGQQKALIIYAMQVKKINLLNLAYNLNIPYDTLKKYKQEKFKLPEEIFSRLCKIAKINPLSLKFSYLPENWGASRAGKLGIAAMNIKYKDKISEWRRKAYIKSVFNNTKQIKLPSLNEELSEFIGICLGDGTLTPYFVRISGDSRYDLLFFKYISKIIKNNFDLDSKISKNNNTLYITIRSKKLCDFLHDNYNLPFGDKILHKAAIPPDIFKNRDFFIPCLRGLIDTDGSLSRRDRYGSQFCLHFCSHNPLLLKQVIKIGYSLGIFSYSSACGTGTNSWRLILKYFKLVGSSNPKHIIRFLIRKKYSKSLYLREVSSYLEKPLYRNLKLPFRMGLWSKG